MDNNLPVMKELSFLLLITTSIISCKDPEGSHRVSVVNNSKETIVHVSSADYPDTVGFQISGCPTKDIGNIIEPEGSKVYAVGSKADALWEDFLSEFPENTLMVFVYNAEAAAAITHTVNGKLVYCDSLESRPDLILKRFDVNMDYLKSHDFKLVYP